MDTIITEPLPAPASPHWWCSVPLSHLPAPLSPLSSPHLLLLLPNLSLYPDPLPSTSCPHRHKKLNRRALASGWLHISKKPSLEPSSVPLLWQLLMNRARAKMRLVVFTRTWCWNLSRLRDFIWNIRTSKSIIIIKLCKNIIFIWW